MKYYYNGMSLNKYCKNNNINYSTITNRIKMLRKENPDKTEDELVFDAINLIPYKYYYDGILLKKYCIKNGINYAIIRNNIIKIIKESPNIGIEEAIELAFNYKKSRYMYEGMSLKKYCDNNNIKYTIILYRLYKILDENPDLSIDEATRKALDNKNHCRYFYKGKSLRSCCKSKNEYITVYRRLVKLIGKYDFIPEEELALVALKEKSIDDILHAFKYKDSEIKNNRLVKKKKDV